LIKAKNWSGKDLKGLWHVTIKIDGVRTLWNGEAWVSRADKPLYNLPAFDGRADCETYCGDATMTSAQRFKQTITQIRAKTKARPITADQLYSLNPLDPRLMLGGLNDPTAETINRLLAEQVAKGFEGLVLRQGDVWLKVKPIETYDVPVTAVCAGQGKHAGRMGYLVTPMGDVGTGFTDEERQEWWDKSVERLRLRTVIEVECMKLTDDGKFRHPRFLHIRIDK
jgi:DNA ligase OB-like domain